MAYCVAVLDGRDELGQVIKCNRPTQPGYKYCEEHKNRPKAIKDRENESINTVIDAADVFAGTPIVDEKPKTGSVQVKERSQPATSVNRAQEVVNKCFSTLDRAIEWEEKSWEKLNSIPSEQWRFIDKTGGEQLRSEIPVYERAMDRTIRAATAIAKLNIDAQAVNINKAIRELIKSVVMRVFQRMELDQQQIDQARLYLAEEFEKVSGEN